MNANVNKDFFRGIYRDLLRRYMTFSYVLGRHFDRAPSRKLASMLYQADLEMTPGMFLSLCFVSAGIVGVMLFIISKLVLTYVIKSPMATQLSVFVAIASFASVCVGFFFSLANKISSKKIEIEREMPFALSYMSILSSAGSTPLKVLSALSIQDYGVLSKEIRKMGYRVYFLGEDAVTAINHLANNTPSVVFRDTLIELGNIIHSGTGMMEFLAERSQDLIDIKKVALKRFMDDLSMFSEMYLLVSMANILAVIGIPMVGLFGLQIGFLTAENLFQLFTYILLPFANILFLAIMEVKYSSLP